MCELLKMCRIFDDGDATITSFTITPESSPQGKYTTDSVFYHWFIFTYVNTNIILLIYFHTRALTANIHMDADEDSDPKLDMKPHTIAMCPCARLTFNVLMDSAFWLDNLNLDCSIIYIEGSQVILSKFKCKSFNEDFLSWQTVYTQMKWLSSMCSLFAKIRVHCILFFNTYYTITSLRICDKYKGSSLTEFMGGSRGGTGGPDRPRKITKI